MLRVRLVPVILIALVTLAVLIGGWQAYLRLDFVNPLQTTLAKIPGVQSVRVRPGTPAEVDIRLGWVPDLQTTYWRIEDVLGEAGSGNERIVLADHPNARLMQVFEYLQPTLQEGLAKQNYREMIADVEHLAAASGVKARITMDEHNVYIQLRDGSYFFYHIVPLRAGGGGP
ncbi:hypothetical protein [Alicyclobacillus cellulosilyticus]|uniref:hypothetical protein n=1 Tax=Alicyclobacillus cellulosilyticus TaxID=1003997 RepID=UPI00166A85C3|nr:hypothetical protein [Alicyclobacillus cellulosilyticus]